MKRIVLGGLMADTRNATCDFCQETHKDCFLFPDPIVSYFGYRKYDWEYDNALFSMKRVVTEDKWVDEQEEHEIDICFDCVAQLARLVPKKTPNNKKEKK